MPMIVLALVYALPAMMVSGSAETLKGRLADGLQCLKSSEDDLRKIIDNMRRTDCGAGESTMDGVSAIRDLLQTVQLEMSLMNFRRELDAMRAEIETLKKFDKEDCCARLNLTSNIAEPQQALEAKRCQSGSALFRPHDQASQVDKQHITFSAPFASVPVVSTGLTRLDVSKQANVRINVGVSNVSTTGFDVAVSEWADTTTYSASVSWMACAD